MKLQPEVHSLAEMRTVSIVLLLLAMVTKTHLPAPVINILTFKSLFNQQKY